MEWFEDLPKGCPPDNAYEPNNDVFYRMSSSCIPKNSDFLSFRTLFPSRIYNGISECITHSLSIFKDLNTCKNFTKLARHKNKSIMKLTLNENDGLIIKSFKNQHHFSWWRSNEFNINNIDVVK